MIEDLAAGQIDAALLWGPIAGYWAKRQKVPIKLVPLAERPARQAAPRLPHLDGHSAQRAASGSTTLNDLIRELQPQIHSHPRRTMACRCSTRRAA